MRLIFAVLVASILLPAGPAAAGGFFFAISGGSIVAAGSGAGAAGVAGLGMVMSRGGYQQPWPPEPSLFLVDAMPLDAEITLNGKPAGSARERGSYPLRLPPGIHTITIAAPGHQPVTRRFLIDGSGFMAKIRVELAQE